MWIRPFSRAADMKREYESIPSHVGCTYPVSGTPLSATWPAAQHCLDYAALWEEYKLQRWPRPCMPCIGTPTALSNSLSHDWTETRLGQRQKGYCMYLWWWYIGNLIEIRIEKDFYSGFELGLYPFVLSDNRKDHCNWLSSPSSSS